MKRMIPVLALVLGLASPAFAATDAGVPTVPAFVADGVSPTAISTPGTRSVDAPGPSMAPADVLHDPLEYPLEAWSDALVARKAGWPVLAFAILVMLTKALAYGRTALVRFPLLGSFAAWLAVGKRAVIVAGVGLVAASGYNVLIAGGTYAAALIAVALAAFGAMHSTTQPGKDAS